MALPNHRLVIGLDYGTTFTGVAYREVTGDDDGGDSKVTVVKNWPGAIEQKVPSDISYSLAPGAERQWGYNISPGARKMVWTKLELEQQERPDELQMILDALDGMRNLNFQDTIQREKLPSYPGKDPVDIIADYLTYIREYLVMELVRTYGAEFLYAIPIDLVISVPAIWSDLAKNRTFRAVHRAGFTTSPHFRNFREMIMVSEPEAAALYAIRSLREEEGEDILTTGDCFVLCDAGGGTVDLISYCVEETAPALKMEKLTIGTSAKCGATFVDRAFIDWVKGKLGDIEVEELVGGPFENNIGSHTIVEPLMQELMEEFEFHKKNFNGTDNPREAYIPLPRPLDVLHVPDRNIINGDIRITDQDLREIFDPCVNRIFELIEGQIGQVEQLGKEKQLGYKVKYVVLTGGFGESGYLFSQLQSFTHPKHISVIRPNHGWSAVVRGAVTNGVVMRTNDLIYMRKCRRHYGVVTSQPFSAFEHLEQDSHIDDFDGERKARDQMTWFLKKGDMLLSNKPTHASIELCRKFGLKDSRVFRTNLLACNQDAAPKRYAEAANTMSIVAALTYDFSDIPTTSFKMNKAGRNGLPYLCAYFRLDIRLDNDNALEFKVTFDEKELGSVTAAYV